MLYDADGSAPQCLIDRVSEEIPTEDLPSGGVTGGASGGGQASGGQTSSPSSPSGGGAPAPSGDGFKNDSPQDVEEDVANAVDNSKSEVCIPIFCFVV
jgi:hypothetical protein